MIKPEKLKELIKHTEEEIEDTCERVQGRVRSPDFIIDVGEKLKRLTSTLSAYKYIEALPEEPKEKTDANF